eukprot:965855-Rhodomonas_salina.2
MLLCAVLRDLSATSICYAHGVLRSASRVRDQDGSVGKEEVAVALSKQENTRGGVRVPRPYPTAYATAYVIADATADATAYAIAYATACGTA